MKAFLVKTQISHLTAIQTKFHTSRHSKYVGGEAADRGRVRRGAAGRGGARRGAVKAVALCGTLALLAKIPFIPLFIQLPRKGKMDEKFDPVQLSSKEHFSSVLFVHLNIWFIENIFSTKN